MIDPITGEVIEENENSLIERKLHEVGTVDQETWEIIDSFLYYKEQFEIFKSKLEKAMRDNDIKKWDNDYFLAYTTEDGMQKRVDTESLKRITIGEFVEDMLNRTRELSTEEKQEAFDRTLYDTFLKMVATKGSLTIKMKGRKNG